MSFGARFASQAIPSPSRSSPFAPSVGTFAWSWWVQLRVFGTATRTRSPTRMVLLNPGLPPGTGLSSTPAITLYQAFGPPPTNVCQVGKAPVTVSGNVADVPLSLRM
jgi:hypothetical protein